MAVGRFDGLVEIGEDVADVLDADREADEFRGDPGGELFFDGELLVGRRGGVNDQRFGVADVGQQREELEGVDQFLAGFVAAFNSECDQAALAVGEILFGALEILGCWRGRDS